MYDEAFLCLASFPGAQKVAWEWGYALSCWASLFIPHVDWGKMVLGLTVSTYNDPCLVQIIVY